MAKKAEQLDLHPEMTLMEHQGLPAKQQAEFNHDALGYLKRADSRSSMPVHWQFPRARPQTLLGWENWQKRNCEASGFKNFLMVVLKILCTKWPRSWGAQLHISTVKSVCLQKGDPSVLWLQANFRITSGSLSYQYTITQDQNLLNRSVFTI